MRLPARPHERPEAISRMAGATTCRPDPNGRQCRGLSREVKLSPATLSVSVHRLCGNVRSGSRSAAGCGARPRWLLELRAEEGCAANRSAERAAERVRPQGRKPAEEVVPREAVVAGVPAAVDIQAVADEVGRFSFHLFLPIGPRFW